MHCRSVMALQVSVGENQKQIYVGRSFEIRVILQQKVMNFILQSTIGQEIQGLLNTSTTIVDEFISGISLVGVGHGKHWSGLDPSNLLIFSNTLLILFLSFVSSLYFFFHSSFSLLHCSRAFSLSSYSLKCL